MNAPSPIPAQAQTNVSVDARRADEVRDVTINLPTSFKYSAEKFYVRECYKSYYDQVIELLRKKDYISVTGTPGIGKSIFYDYFFSRYRSEYPGRDIVTASFNKNQLLKKCVVFFTDGSSLIWENTDFPNIAKHIPNALHLYDGPPSVEPADSKMVTFTSPNFGWLDSMRKNVNAHRTLYMPVWELGELWDAVNLLSLNISSQELSNRYQQLGGVPRYCLQTESDDYQQGLVEIEEAIEKIKTFEDVQACFEKSMPTNLVAHRLLYYFPDTRSRRTATLRFGSDMIGQEIFKRLRVKLDREREKLILWLDGAGKASTFQGWMLETLVNEKLITGGDFTYVQLDQQRQKQVLSVNPTIVHYERFETNFTLEMVFRNVYQMPTSQSSKSIDSYILSTNRLFLFQITISNNHPVNSEGLVDFFAKLGLVNKIKQNPNFVQLIFVVPDGMRDTYSRQNLNSQDVPSMRDLMAADVVTIPRIGPVLRQKLNKKNIFTCSDLNHHAQDPEVKYEFELLTKYIARLNLVSDLSYLDMIPQFVLGMPV
ncbi:unnamed protein product [Aphanomyces euteiches]